nr:ATP synthase F0 subunit 6 [Crassicauda magna]
MAYIWNFIFLYLLYMEICKFNFFGVLAGVINVFFENFVHQGLQSNFFFKFFVYLLCMFWIFGMFFPLYSFWSSVGFLFFMTTFSWLSVRVYTLMSESFFVLSELEHSWSWVTSLVMFFSHLLSYLMSGVALCLRISIIFSIGHFLMFFFLGLGSISSFFLIFIVLPVELFFAFLQSYIFLTLICMFLLNMI